MGPIGNLIDLLEITDLKMIGGEAGLKAVIYARYSSDNQREESIEGQIRECTAFAEKNGITILKHYIDRAYSAKTDNRPEFQRMINDGR